MATWQEITLAVRNKQDEKLKTHKYLTTYPDHEDEKLYVCLARDKTQRENLYFLAGVESICNTSAGVEVTFEKVLDQEKNEVIVFPYSHVLTDIPDSFQ